MIYKYDDKELDLSKLIRLYPASVVELDGEISEMSLEWTQLNEDKVNILRYVLVFDFTPQAQEQKIKTTINFETKEALLAEMQKVAQLFS